jgi:hypothetical protein
LTVTVLERHGLKLEDAVGDRVGVEDEEGAGIVDGVLLCGVPGERVGDGDGDGVSDGDAGAATTEKYPDFAEEGKKYTSSST